MLGLLASLTIGMSVKDEAFKAGMATARAEAKKTGQDFERHSNTMARAIERAAQAVNAAAIRVADSVAQIGRDVRDAGLKMTAGLTLPLGALAVVSKRTASDFQSAMGAVQAAMLSASPGEIEKLRDAALDLGPAFGKSAIEAAAAIEALAKNGMGAAAILGGGLKSALTLAVVGQTDLGVAADATTDILEQFSLSTTDLPTIVNKVSGALDASKLSMDDYRLAIGQAGGVTGSLGYSFDDFNTALAATAPLFDSGSQAGTSFRAFLTSLAGKSEDAQKVMKQLGLELYNTDGSAKSLAAIADELQLKMGNLSDKAKNVALDKMFGADGGQTAVALIKLGAEGIGEVAAAIDKVTADQKMAILLEGEAAATQRLASAWEKLKIVIGEAGIIQAFTMIKDAAASVVNAIAGAPPWFFKLGVAVGALVASIGPLILIGGTLAKIVLPLMLLRLGPLALGFTALLNPFGVLIRLLGQLALQAGAVTILGRLGAAMIGFAGPIGIAITAISILIPLVLRKGQASDAARAATDTLSEANRLAADREMQLATATGKAREEILAKARADRIAAAAAIQTAKADMVAARAAYARAKMVAPDPRTAGQTLTYTGAGGGAAFANLGGQRVVQDARADLQERMKALETALGTFAKLDGMINAAAAPAKIDMTFGGDAKPKTTKTPKATADDSARNEAQYLDDLGRARVEYLDAYADLTGSYRARYDAEVAAIAEDRASYARQLALDKDLTAEQRAALLAAKDKTNLQRTALAEQARHNAQAQETADLANAEYEIEAEALRHTIDMADNMADRRDGELKLLDLQRQKEEADLDLVLATKATASAEWQNALKRKEALDGIYAARREAAERATEGPGAAYIRDLNMSAGAIDEAVQESAVSSLKQLNTELASAIMGAGSLADAFANMGRRIIQSLIEIAIQQAVIKPLANSLLGSADAAGNRSGGILGSIASAVAGLSGGGGGGDTWYNPEYGGGRATGGAIRADRWYDVGERGPERFYPGISGTVVPNNGRGDRAPQRVKLEVVGTEGKFFAPTMRVIAGQTSAEVITKSGRRSQMRGRAQLA